MVAKRGRKRKTVEVVDTSGHTRATRDLENLRKQYVRRIKQFKDTANNFRELGNDYLADKYMDAADSLDTERKRLTVKNITASKPTSKEYKEDVNKAIKDAKSRLSDVKLAKPKDIVSRETLGKVRYKYADEIFQWSYSKGIWGEDDNNNARTEKLKAYYRKVNNLPDDAKVSEADLLDFFEREIGKDLNIEDFELNTSAETNKEEPNSVYQRLKERHGWGKL